MSDWTTPKGRAKLRALLAQPIGPEGPAIFGGGDMLELLDALKAAEERFSAVWHAIEPDLPCCHCGVRRGMHTLSPPTFMGPDRGCRGFAADPAVAARWPRASDRVRDAERKRDEARRIAGAFAVRGIDATGTQGPTHADAAKALAWAAERRAP